jgi:hypothetical protein
MLVVFRSSEGVSAMTTQSTQGKLKAMGAWKIEGGYRIPAEQGGDWAVMRSAHKHIGWEVVRVGRPDYVLNVGPKLGDLLDFVASWL